MKRLASAALIVTASLVIGAPAASLPLLPDGARLLTLTTADDDQPVVSPNGKDVVFVSTRSGYQSLHHIELRKSRIDTARPVALMAGRAWNPVFSPDGRQLAFLSTAENALGDVYTVSWPGRGKPHRITDTPTSKGELRVDPSTGSFVWAEQSMDGTIAWSNEAGRIANPDLAPAPPPAPAAAWDPGRQVALLWADDTNRDGVLGEGDAPSAWRRYDGQWRRLTLPMPGTLGIAFDAKGNSLVLVGDWYGTRCLAHLPGGNWLADRAPGSVYTEALAILELEPERMDDAIALLEVAEQAPEFSERARIARLRALNRAGRHAEVITLLDGDPAGDPETELTRLEALVYTSSPASQAPLVVALRELAGQQGAGRPELSREALAMAARSALKGNRPMESLGLLQELMQQSAEMSTNEQLQHRLLLADVYTELRLPESAIEGLLEMAGEADASIDASNQVASRLAALALATDPEGDAAILGLRSLAARIADQAPAVALNLRVEEARLLEQRGDLTRAEETLAHALLAARTDAPRLAPQIAGRLAEIRVQRGDFDGATEAIMSLGASEDAAVAEATRARLLQYLLEKGRRELVLRDPMLALSTFDRLLAMEPGNVPAWRGRIAAVSTDSQLLDEAIALYRRGARKLGATPLDLYKYGLALSYREPESKAALSAVRRAAEAGPMVPYYLLTQGFLLEQQFHRSERDASPDYAHLEGALECYARAIALVPLGDHRQLQADLLLNSANAALLLRQNFRALELYRRRAQTGVAFPDDRTTLLFHWNHGIAAFRSSAALDAATEFTRALEVLDRVEQRELLTADRVAEVRRELRGRRALAWLDSRLYMEAAAEFAELAELEPENSMARARAFRNQTVALERAAATGGVVGGERLRLLAEGRRAGEAALALLSLPDLRPIESREPSAMLSFSMTLSSDAVTGGAKVDLGRADEQRFVLATLARIAEHEGDTDRAIRMEQRMLELQPRIDDTNRAYEMAARSVVLMSLSHAAESAGDIAEATARAAEGLAISRFEVADYPIIDANAATRHLVRLLEIAMLHGDEGLAAHHGAFWMLDPLSIQGLSGMEVLQQAAEALAQMDDPAYPGTPLLAVEQHARREWLVEALAAEQIARKHLEASANAEGLGFLEDTMQASLWLSRAESAAHALAMGSDLSSGSEELSRLRLLGWAALIRVAAMRGGESVAAAVEGGLAEATRIGMPDWRWWLVAQAALVAQPEAATPLAVRALEELEAAVVYTNTEEQDIPWGLLDLVEGRTLDASVTGEEAWQLVERWRNVRIRMVAAGAGLTGSTPAETAWLTAHRRLQGEYREALARQKRAVALGRDGGAVVEARAEAVKSHEAAGRAAGLMIAHAMAPAITSLDDVVAFFAPPQAYDPPASLLVARRVGGADVAWIHDGTGFRPFDPSNPPEGPVFLLGDAPEGLGDQVVHVLNGDSLLRLAERASFDAGDAEVVYTGDQSALEMVLASKLRIGNGVRVHGPEVGAWPVVGLSRTLGEVVDATSALDALATTLDAPRAPWAPLALALWGYQSGLLRVEASGDSWLSLLMRPDQVPGLANEELRIANDQMNALLDGGATDAGLLQLERVIFLMEALGPEGVERFAGNEPAYRQELALYHHKAAELRAANRQAERAVHHASRRVWLLGGDSPAPELVRWMAGIASQAGANDIADDLYVETIRLYTEAGDEALALAALRDRAINLESGGRFGEAWSLGMQAREAMDPADVAATAEQDIRLARVARIYLNRYPEARRLLERARANAAALPEIALEAQINLARVAWLTGRFDEAMDLLAVAHDEATALGSEEKLAEVALERTNVHWFRAEYFAAFTQQREALAAGREMGNLPIQVAALNIAGLVSWSLNDHERAFDHLREAMALAERMGVAAEIATTANNIGLVHRSRREYDAALTWFGRALAVDEREGNRWGVAYSLRNMAMAQLYAGDAAGALAPLQRAVALAGEIGDETNLAKSHHARGDVYTALGDAAAARADYAAALALAERLPLPDLAWRCLHGQAALDESEGNLVAAVLKLSRAIDLVDTMRAAILIEEFQDGFLLDKQDLYDTMIRLQLDLGRVEAALETSEKSRGRNFIDLLGNRSLKLRSDEDEKQLAQEHALRARVEDLQRELNGAEEAVRPAIEQLFDTARRDYADFMISLRAANPQLSGFVRVDPVSVAELRALLDDGTRLVIYHVLPEELVIWVLDRTTLVARRVPVTAEELGAQVLRVRQGLQDFEPVETRLATLSELLVEPMLGAAAGAERLCIVPHRVLHSLPFGALPAGGRTSLLDRFSLFNAPSASVLRYTTARRNAVAAGGVLAIGNPDLGDATLSLPFAQKEAERLRFNYPDLTLRTGTDASETWATRFMRDYSIVHIASHGEYNPAMPLFSGLMLSPDGQNDGVLSAEEVFGLEIRADLIALSACQTGLGRLSNGDDIVGLGRSFVYAGTRQLLTTLWRVDDVSTALLFKYFYRNLATMDRAEALRQAQLQLRADPEYAHPSHWSSVVLSGDWQ